MAKSTTSQPVVSGLTSQSTRGRDYDEEMDARIQVSGKLHRSCVCAADMCTLVQKNRHVVHAIVCIAYMDRDSHMSM